MGDPVCCADHLLQETGGPEPAGLEELVFVPCGHPTGLRGCTQRGQLVRSELCGKHGMDLKVSLGIPA